VIRPASAPAPPPIGDWQVKGVAYNPPFAFDPALPRAFSSPLESPGGSENEKNQTNRAVDLMQSDRKPL
jgi:hypothetical protein